MRFVRRLAAIGLLVYLAAVAARVTVRKFYIWLPGYFQWSLEARPAPRRPVHVFFLYADHFEPGSRLDRVERWLVEYPRLAQRHRDADGRTVRHTWFYPGEQPSDVTMQALRKLAAGGNGEVELHYHHGNDTDASTRVKFAEAIQYFQRFGFLKTIDGRTHFAFVHGNWGLDSGNGPKFCGAYNELRLLTELGCFADFTFPSLWHRAQPSWVNAIVEARDDSRPKSYDRGEALRVGSSVAGGLMLLPGPLVIFPTLNPRRLFFRIEDGDIHPAFPLTEQRVDLWVKANVHVKGKPEWIFVKVHGHSASGDADMAETLGAHYDRALSYLGKRYNDGVNYVLHYVTAREAYNLVRAAVAGQPGDPRQYLNWVIPPYEAGGRTDEASHPEGLKRNHRR